MPEVKISALPTAGTPTTNDSIPCSIGATDTVRIKINRAASGAPTVTDDSASGYAVGSQWYDTVASKAYLCMSASVGSASWTEITASGGGGSGDVTAAANIADNAIVRGDGGAKGVQTSSWALDDAGGLSGAALSTSGAITSGGDLSVTGNVSVTGTVDGRDVSADGAKLDTAVIGPGASTDRAIVTYNGTGGILARDSGVVINASDQLEPASGDLEVNFPVASTGLVIRRNAGGNGTALAIYEGATLLWRFNRGLGSECFHNYRIGWTSSTAYLTQSANELQLHADNRVSAQFGDPGSPAADDTHMQLLTYDGTSWTLQRVTKGAADSGGTGFALLRVPN